MCMHLPVQLPVYMIAQLGCIPPVHGVSLPVWAEFDTLEDFKLHVLDISFLLRDILTAYWL